MPSPEESPLLKEIEAAVALHRDRIETIRVSIQAEPMEQVDASDGETYLVKLLCWNLASEDDKYLTDPVFSFVGDWVTEDEIRDSLLASFSEYEVVVDNDVGVKS